jgi:hypothetical protein
MRQYAVWRRPIGLATKKTDTEVIVEPIMKKSDVAVRLDPPPVRRVQRATEQKERIEDKSKPLHNSAGMINPKPNPGNNFSRKTLVRITALRLLVPGRKSSHK